MDPCVSTLDACMARLVACRNACMLGLLGCILAVLVRQRHKVANTTLHGLVLCLARAVLSAAKRARQIQCTFSQAFQLSRYRGCDNQLCSVEGGCCQHSRGVAWSVIWGLYKESCDCCYVMAGAVQPVHSASCTAL